MRARDRMGWAILTWWLSGVLVAGAAVGMLWGGWAFALFSGLASWVLALLAVLHAIAFPAERP